ncbi:hypothetical protein [Selenomonas sp. KH1T6]|uniref:hypothetical protein n=1 Tax=Selenomonas sp. KH1T6 TaxID=3158784 RepID=UPI0008A75E89|nr:hypothetical protein SAMN05216583_1486 [Selenomonas ruminantium]
MGRLKDKIEMVEANNTMEKKSVVQKMVNSNKRPDMRQISAKVNRETYEKFTEICRLNGMSNNSCLNMIIAEFVREKVHLLNG